MSAGAVRAPPHNSCFVLPLVSRHQGQRRHLASHQGKNTVPPTAPQDTNLSTKSLTFFISLIAVASDSCMAVNVSTAPAPFTSPVCLAAERVLGGDCGLSVDLLWAVTLRALVSRI
ncbi:hypothetical protein WMY93_023022 [Mugilogobius chulae]|uniref:Uncharacterized protein n=1 Tax=Mugilogobius chulae TaxID=88201 RepID=A0AAW0N368_9GOBI